MATTQPAASVTMFTPRERIARFSAANRSSSRQGRKVGTACGSGRLISRLAELRRNGFANPILRIWKLWINRPLPQAVLTKTLVAFPALAYYGRLAFAFERPLERLTKMIPAL